MKIWSNRYLTNVPMIDEQHKELFSILERCYDLLIDKHSIDKYDKIADIIEELRDYTIYHFREEEEYQLSVGYRKFLSHKVQHDDFIKKISEFNLDEIDENQDKYIKELLDFVLEWIAKHILIIDKEIMNNLRK